MLVPPAVVYDEPVDLYRIESASRLEARGGNRRSSKSVSGARPPIATSAISHRMYGTDSAGPSSSPTAGSSRSSRGLKRRISTPNLAKRSLTEEDAEKSEEPQLNAVKQSETRARSTSTSIVVPQQLAPPDAEHTRPVQTLTAAPATIAPLPTPAYTSTPPPPWSQMYVTPPSPPPTTGPESQDSDDSSDGFLSSAYDMGETIVNRVLSWANPPRRGHARHDSRRSLSDEDSEKGLDGTEIDEFFDEEDDSLVGIGSVSRSGRYWGLFSNGAQQPESPDTPTYFTLPPTPPVEEQCDLPFPQSLPTPALSTRSLSGRSRHGRPRRSSRAAAVQSQPVDGWWVKVYRTIVSSGSGSGKTTEVLRELGWTVAFLAGLFVVSLLLVFYAISSIPITQLKSMPKSTTDLQLLSAEMRAYMGSSRTGWWHCVCVLTYIGFWKHAWSVPGAVVLNILVGSVFEPLPALTLLTLITASGSLGAYMLSRPLAPLIGVLFPKPLALVRAALAPEQVPRPRHHLQYDEDGQLVTPIHVSTDPTGRPLGAPEDRPGIWRRLLIMRAMGFVPWSGMNVACGVVGVDWRIFWLTTAAGSASWSYVTASVGNILSRLALPTGVTAGGAVDGHQGESLTSLLRDPVLISKLVFLTLLTVVPVLFKRRSQVEEDDDSSTDEEPTTPTTPTTTSVLGLTTGLDSNEYPPEPSSPLAVSLATFTPTPHVFDLLSFGRMALRQGVRVVAGTARATTQGARRLVSNFN